MTKLLSILSLATLTPPVSFISPISKVGNVYNDSSICTNTTVNGSTKVTKTDYTVHYEGNSGDRDDQIEMDKYIKGHGTYFKEPTVIDLETTSRSTRLRMIMQQYSFDVVVPPNTEKTNFVQLTVPLSLQAYLNGFIFGTNFEACVCLFNQGNDGEIGYAPYPIHFVPSYEGYFSNYCDVKKFRCGHDGIGMWREYDKTWSNICLSTEYKLFNYNETESRIRKCYFSVALYILGQTNSLNGNTGATLKLQDDIKLEKI